MHIKQTCHILTMASLIMLCPLTGPKAAQTQNQITKSPLIDIMPTKSLKDMPDTATENTHPPIRLTPDKSEIITLDKEAASIIIGNPNHLSILADSAKRLVLVPRAPGASSFTVLDKAGNIIMQRHAIIASPKKQYVRIRRSCAGATDNKCQPTKIFYCPDMCHEIIIDNNEDAAAPTNAGSPSNESQNTPPDDSPDDEIE